MAREHRGRKPVPAGGGHGRPHRMMAVWSARHDNGWSTSVVENPNGSFAAWAAPQGHGGGVYSIVEDADEGKAAAVASLQRHTGHDGCSADCGVWTLQTYAVFDRRPNVGRSAARGLDTGKPAAQRIA